MLWNLKDALANAPVRAVRAPPTTHRVEIADARQGRVGRVGCLDGRSALLAPLAHANPPEQLTSESGAKSAALSRVAPMLLA